MLTVALVACGSSDDLDEDDGAAPTSDATTSEPTEPPGSTDPTTEPEGEGVSGEIYTYAIPDGWQDASSDPSFAQADTAVRSAEPVDDFLTNVNVVVTPAQGVTDVQSLREQFASELQEVAQVTPEALPDATIDGVAALAQRGRFTTQGVDVTAVQYLTIRADSFVVVTLTSSQAEVAAAQQTMDDLLTSWAWTG